MSMCLWGASQWNSGPWRPGRRIWRGRGAARHRRLLVGSTQLPNTQDVRGYVVHFDQDLQVDWTALTPGDVMFEMAMDGWSEEPGVVEVLTWRLTTEDGYHAAIHTFDSTGVWRGTTVPPLTQ